MARCGIIELSYVLEAKPGSGKERFKRPLQIDKVKSAGLIHEDMCKVEIAMAKTGRVGDRLR